MTGVEASAAFVEPVMPDHPPENPDPELNRPGEDDAAEAPSIRSEPHRSDDKSVTERAQDEADTLGDFA